MGAALSLIRMEHKPMKYDPKILYARKTIHSRERVALYRVLAQGEDWVTVVVNDGRVPGKPGSIDFAQFEAEFEPTTERVNQ
jgi:hypothetical protein